MFTVFYAVLSIGISTALHLTPVRYAPHVSCRRSNLITNCAADAAVRQRSEDTPVSPPTVHTDGHMWDASAGDGAFQDFERECFGDEDGCDYWFYGGPSPFGSGDLESTPEHIAHINHIRAEGRAAVVARERKEREQQEALQRIEAAAHQQAKEATIAAAAAANVSAARASEATFDLAPAGFEWGGVY